MQTATQLCRPDADRKPKINYSKSSGIEAWRKGSCFLINVPPNKSLDVRAKQRLCFYVALFPWRCVYSVSPHVNSIVSLFLNKNSNRGIFEIERQRRSAFLLKLREDKRRAEDNDAANNSMDVRAKHGRCFVCQVVRCFAPRHLNRWASSVFDGCLIAAEYWTFTRKVL